MCQVQKSVFQASLLILLQLPLAAFAWTRLRARRLAWLPADRGTVWPMRGRDIVALGLMPLGMRDEAAIISTQPVSDHLFLIEKVV